jgi:Rieske Fe-S protein
MLRESNTDEVQVDEEFETRRSFAVEILAFVVGGLVGLIPAGIGIFAFLDPLRKQPKPSAFQKPSSEKEGFARVTALEALAVGGPPRRFPVINDKRDAWNYLPDQPVGAVYVQRTGNDSVRVFNVTCPHAGCSVSCDGTSFRCPCHNSSFDLDGTKTVSRSGRENPSPRSLDELVVDPELLNQGEIWVEFKNFYTGIEDKTPKA